MLNSSSYQTSSPVYVDDNQFLQEVIEGLRKPQKTISPKYFYDTTGSQYFDDICQLPEYYPYRSELQLLPQVISEVDKIIPTGASIVEFGAGALTKIRFLLEGLSGVKDFIPIDIAKDFLHQQCDRLKKDFPDLNVHPVASDFCKPLQLPSNTERPILGFFPGSTIGNFSPQFAKRFLLNARSTLGSESRFLVGVDTKKAASVLHRAYNDTQGVTARFNLNLLTRINRELSADFVIDKFEHYAFYNIAESRIEMHLISTEDQTVLIAGQEIHFQRGESIHTECSYKYSAEEFNALAQSAGWETQMVWMAEDDAFSMHLLKTRSDFRVGSLQ